jgi:hypothetical protein
MAAQAARRMPQTQLVVITDREGDLYELHDAVQIGPANLHALIRAQHSPWANGASCACPAGLGKRSAWRQCRCAGHR